MYPISNKCKINVLQFNPYVSNFASFIYGYKDLPFSVPLQQGNFELCLKRIHCMCPAYSLAPHQHSSRGYKEHEWFLISQQHYRQPNVFEYLDLLSQKLCRIQGHSNLFYGLLFLKCTQSEFTKPQLILWMQSFHQVQLSLTSSLFPLSALSASGSSLNSKFP